MKKLNKKSKISAIIFILLLTISATFIACVPIAFGVSTQAFVATVPKIIGVGETIYIVGWVSPAPPFMMWRYHNYTFTITRPDGTTDPVVIPESNTEGTKSFSYVCNQEGTWKVVLSFDGEYDRESSVSPPTSWTVEKDYVIPTYPIEPLPTEYWRYPINTDYREWYQISGAWPHSANLMSGVLYNASGGSFNPYSTAPNSAHILWKKQFTKGGLLGGVQGWLGSSTAAGAPVTAQGRLYYTELTGDGSTTNPRLYCLDQYTGEEIYAVDLPSDPTQPGTGNILALEISPRFKEGTGLGTGEVFSLWVMGNGLWEVDPWTGRVLYYLPMSYPFGDPGAGFNIMYPSYNDGAIYIPHYPNYLNITKWSTRTKQVVWTIQADPSVQFQQLSESPNTRGFTIWGDYAVIPAYLGWQGKPFKIMTYDVATGDLVANGTEADYSTPASGVAAYGNYYIPLYDMRVHAYSIATGNEVWKSEQQNNYPWGGLFGYWGAAAYGNVYFGCLDGYLRCYNGATGATVWEHYSEDTTETAMGTYPWWGGAVIADGKIYAATGQHTSPNPPERGNKLYCLDAYTGDLIWSFDGICGTYNSGGISSGMLFYNNRNDGCLYMFGKGQSATTASVSPKIIAKGSSVLIEGTVTDQTPGDTSLGIPAAGTPAISDEDMSEWMQYLYMQRPIPTDAVGVEVTLDAIDANGNWINIDTVTSDMAGMFKKMWTPEIEGEYTIIATFAGSESYWSSYAETAIGVGPEPSPTQQIEPEEPAEAPLITTEVAIILAVVAAVVIGIVAYWIVKKRK